MNVERIRNSIIYLRATYIKFFFCLILYFIIKLFQLKTQVLTTVAEMLKNIEIIRFLYPDFR
jgi:hypothetical protein